MRNLFIFLVGCLMISSSYGMMEAQEVMQIGKIVYHPIGVVANMQPVSLEDFEKKSDDLYLSIDDFLDDNKKYENCVKYSCFMHQCIALSGYSKYNQLLCNKIIPDLKVFVNEDAPCELGGLYPEQDVEAFLEYMRLRLNCFALFFPTIGLVTNDK